MKKFIGVIGGILIAISVFLPSITAGPISVSLWDAPDSKSTVYIFIAFGIIIAICSYLGQKWSNIVAVIVALLALGLSIKWISDAYGIPLTSAGIGLWIGAIGSILGIAGPFVKDKTA